MKSCAYLSFATIDTSLNSKVYDVQEEREKGTSLPLWVITSQEKMFENGIQPLSFSQISFYFLVPLSSVTKKPHSLILLQLWQVIQMDSIYPPKCTMYQINDLFPLLNKNLYFFRDIHFSQVDTRCVLLRGILDSLTR